MEGVVLEVGRPEKEAETWAGRRPWGGKEGAQGRRVGRRKWPAGRGCQQLQAERNSRKNTCPRVRQTWVQTPALPLPRHVTQGKPLNRGDFA